MTYQKSEYQNPKDETPYQEAPTNTDQQYAPPSDQPLSGYNNPHPQDLPENYMVLSIVATVVGFLTCCVSCCISGILGVIAIVFSSQVSTKYISGDYQGALNSAKTAKILAIISLVVTGVSFVGTIAYYAVLLSSSQFDTFWQEYIDTLEQLR